MLNAATLIASLEKSWVDRFHGRVIDVYIKQIRDIRDIIDIIEIL